MIDPAEWRRLAQECAEDDATIRRIDAEFSKPGGVEANPRMRSEIAKATLRIRDNAAAISSALTAAAELSGALDRTRAMNDDWAESAAEALRGADQFRAERDAARAEVERLRAGIRLEIERHPTSLGEGTSAGEELRRLIGDT